MAFGNSANNVSSPVSLSKVTQVFDSASSGSMRDYLRGSLPYPVTNAYSSIAASGTLTLNSFAAANNPPAILDHTFINVSDFQFYGGPTCSVQVTLSSNGTLYEYEGGNLQTSYKWLYAGHQADYQVRFVETFKNQDSGATFSGTVDTWLSLSGSKTWYISQPTVGFRTNSWTGFLEIRMAASPFTIMSNCSISMSADVEF